MNSRILPVLTLSLLLSATACALDSYAEAVVRIVAAAKEVNLSVPLVVRLEGTNVQQGKDILANSGLPIVPANDLGDAAKKIVAEVRKAA